ncbi:MAG TPA: phosphatase PAP2 family protein [Saprospiraceae bacterium]|nr:phosphatase PAP2 family protein [Saprospiraceae bacterium]
MDPILFWNEIALEANRNSHTTLQDAGSLGPPLSARALAIVHLAIYEAYAGAKHYPGQLPPYLPGLPLPPLGASPDAAVAAAAKATLNFLHPSQSAFFQARYIFHLDGLPPAGIPAGVAFGEAVAAAILADRNADPGVGDSMYQAPLHRGGHRKDPDNSSQPYHAPKYGALAKCFSVKARHSLDAPPAIDSPEYMAALKEVRGKGITPELMGSLPGGYPKRTVDETLIGIYWAYDGAAGLGTPPRLYNQIVRTVAAHRGNTPDENARLFALVNVAMADAGILAWADKYKYNLWRPVLAIREHDDSMGPQGQPNNNIHNSCDTNWLPLGAPATNSIGKKNFTPPFPAYPSGHATFGAAALHMTRLFYGVSGSGPDDLLDGLTFYSEEFDGNSYDNRGTVRPRHARHFPEGLWQMMMENCLSRVYLGVHWVFDSFVRDDQDYPDLSRFVGGLPLGMRIAEDIFGDSREDGMRKSTV